MDEVQPARETKDEIVYRGVENYEPVKDINTICERVLRLEARSETYRSSDTAARELN